MRTVTGCAVTVARQGRLVETPPKPQRGLPRCWRRHYNSVPHDGTWRSPVAHCNGVAGVAGSNPAVPMGTEPTASGRLCRTRPHPSHSPSPIEVLHAWLDP